MSKDRNLASMLEFVLSKDGLILLGSQQAVEDVAGKLTEERRILNMSGGSVKNILKKDTKLPELKPEPQRIKSKLQIPVKNDQQSTINVTEKNSRVGKKISSESKILSATSKLEISNLPFTSHSEE